MAGDDPQERAADEGMMEVSKAHYRSLVLEKLRAEINAKRARYDMTQNAPLEALNNMSYWKMAYYKMKYWKAGHLENAGDRVVDPLNEAGGIGEL